MNDHALAAFFVLAVWWLSTCLVLWMVWLGRAWVRYSVSVFALLGLVGAVGLYATSKTETTTSAYLAFASALAVWGFHELTFLLGIVSGPRKTPCPPEARGWNRFVYSTLVVIHHEVLLAATMLAVVTLTWRSPNQVGTWTFFVLWIMRLSAKLNVFLGVRNLSEQFVPDHLRYMVSYFRRARMNPLMPVSVVVGGAFAVRLGTSVVAGDAPQAVLVGQTLVASILMLAVVEHVFLAVPVPDAVLWRWAIRRRAVLQ